MTRTLTSRLCIPFLAAAALAATAFAQTAAPAAPPAQRTAAKPAPAGPTPKSPEELAALKAVLAAAQNAAGTPAQFDAAVQDLLTKFPQTEFKEWAYTIGTQYHYQHNDYAGTLEYGENALKTDAKAMVPLLIMASAIPQEVRSTDLDRDQRLAQAENYDNSALAYADHFPSEVNGRPLTPQQVSAFQQTIRATAHSSLGMIAADRQQYPHAVLEFQQAIQLEAAQNQARDYYRLAQAQEGAKNYKDALASLDKALQLGATNRTLQTLANAEKEKINRAMATPATTHP